MKHIFAALIILILMSGCTTSYRVHLSGYASPESTLPQNAQIHVEADIKTQDPRLKTQDSRHVYLVCCLESAEELSPSRN
jgi:hypothetical protein